MNTQPAIRIENLRKSYKNVEVLKGVNLTVPKGSIYALLGANGAGKTTTISILATLARADSGTVTIAGIDINKEPSKVRERISLTGQFAAVDDLLTGRENLEMIGSLYQLKKSDVASRAVSLLDRFGLTEAADRRTSTYSGGMRRKLDLAISLIANPEIIFLDEPTTGLDPRSRRELWAIVKGLAKDGTTILLTTQYLDEADQLADTVAVLHNGTIVAEDTPAKLKELAGANTLDDVFMKLTRPEEN
jgi:ABC-2 type transport system ATP-binding protein